MLAAFAEPTCKNLHDNTGKVLVLELFNYLFHFTKILKCKLLLWWVAEYKLSLFVSCRFITTGPQISQEGGWEGSLSFGKKATERFTVCY